MTSSPARTTAWMALKMASVAPLVTVISAPGSTATPYTRWTFSAIASRRAGMPVMGAYWLCPWRMARSRASTSRGGTSKSGKPWPRLTAPCSAASWDMTVKMVVPTCGSLLWRSMRRVYPRHSGRRTGYNVQIPSLARPGPCQEPDARPATPHAPAARARPAFHAQRQPGVRPARLRGRGRRGAAGARRERFGQDHAAAGAGRAAARRRGRNRDRRAAHAAAAALAGDGLPGPPAGVEVGPRGAGKPAVPVRPARSPAWPGPGSGAGDGGPGRLRGHAGAAAVRGTEKAAVPCTHLALARAPVAA